MAYHNYDLPNRLYSPRSAYLYYNKSQDTQSQYPLPQPDPEYTSYNSSQLTPTYSKLFDNRTTDSYIDVHPEKRRLSDDLIHRSNKDSYDKYTHQPFVYEEGREGISSSKQNYSLRSKIRDSENYPSYLHERPSLQRRLNDENILPYREKTYSKETRHLLPEDKYNQRDYSQLEKQNNSHVKEPSNALKRITFLESQRGTSTSRDNKDSRDRNSRLRYDQATKSTEDMLFDKRTKNKEWGPSNCIKEEEPQKNNWTNGNQRADLLKLMEDLKVQLSKSNLVNKKLSEERNYFKKKYKDIEDENSRLKIQLLRKRNSTSEERRIFQEAFNIKTVFEQSNQESHLDTEKSLRAEDDKKRKSRPNAKICLDEIASILSSI